MSSESFLNSVSQYIHLLKEKDHRIVEIALNKLIQVVDVHWAEISNHLETIELL